MGQRLLGGKQIQSTHLTLSIDDLGSGSLWLFRASTVDEINGIGSAFSAQSTGGITITVEDVDGIGVIFVNIDEDVHIVSLVYGECCRYIYYNANSTFCTEWPDICLNHQHKEDYPCDEILEATHDLHR